MTTDLPLLPQSSSFFAAQAPAKCIEEKDRHRAAAFGKVVELTARTSTRGSSTPTVRQRLAQDARRGRDLMLSILDEYPGILTSRPKAI